MFTIVLFPEYHGGHHLGNLLGLSYGVSFMHDQEVYRSYQNAAKAHVYHDKIFLDAPDFLTTYTMNKTNMIGISHFGAFEHVYLNSQIEKDASNTNIIVVRIPDSGNHIVINRCIKHGYNMDISEYSIAEQRAIYKQETIQRLCPNAKVCEISSESLFSKDISNVKTELNYYGIDINLKYQYLHDVWYRKNAQ